MWELKADWHELVARAAVVFIFMFIVFRIWGKKHFGELSPFDLVLLLIISESVQGALTADDHSVPGAAILVLTLMGLNVLLNRLGQHSPKLEKIIEGCPVILALDGKMDLKAMHRESVTESELEEGLRMEGVDDIREVAKATLETSGKISVIKKKLEA